MIYGFVFEIYCNISHHILDNCQTTAQAYINLQYPPHTQCVALASEYAAELRYCKNKISQSEVFLRTLYVAVAEALVILVKHTEKCAQFNQ